MPSLDWSEIQDRVIAALEALGVATPDRIETVLALLDDQTPHPFSRLAEAGLTMEAGATTRQLLDYIAPRLGKGRMDRELRDQIMLPLREVGVLGQAWWDSANARLVADYWEPKSPNNLYVLTEEFRELILGTRRSHFLAVLEEWQQGDAVRREKAAARAAAVAAAAQPGRLVPLTIEHYCAVQFPDWELVFVDDADGRRIPDEFADRVEELGLPLDLRGRWPDIILRDPQSGEFWVVDCVKSDGEIDTVRRDELLAAFEERGLAIAGFTTAYETVKRFAQRQQGFNNIADGTYIWILEIGGSHFLKESLVG